MRVICDTGPLVAAADRKDPAHGLAKTLVLGLGRDLLIPDPVLVEADQYFRRKASPLAASAILESITEGPHSLLFLSPNLLRRAVQIDAGYRDLDLGLVDAVVMAFAERHDLPILTFDFRDFRATAPERGEWRLVVDESRYLDATRG